MATKRQLEEQIAEITARLAATEADCRMLVESAAMRTHRALVVIHPDGYVEVYADPSVSVHVCEVANTSKDMDEVVTWSIPTAYRRLYGGKLAGNGMPLRWSAEDVRQEAERWAVGELLAAGIWEQSDEVSGDSDCGAAGGDYGSRARRRGCCD